MAIRYAPPSSPVQKIKSDPKPTSNALARIEREPVEEVRVLQVAIDEISKADVRKGKISIRLDKDVLEWLRSGGPGWQSKINKALRAAMENSRP